MGCRKFLVATGKKLAERSPLQHPIVLQVRSLLPTMMVDEREKSQKLFYQLILSLVEKGIVNACTAEKVETQYLTVSSSPRFSTEVKDSFTPDDKNNWPPLDNFFSGGRLAPLESIQNCGS